MKSKLVISLLLMLAVSSVTAADYDATIKFAHKVMLSVPVTGEISQLNVKTGNKIKQGDILLSLDKVPFEASVSQEQANVVKQEAILQETRRDMEQLTELYERGVLSAVELENGKLKFQRASADHRAAQSRLVKAQYNLEHSSVKAPFSGWVLDIKVNQHEMVNNVVKVMPLMSVAEKDKYEAFALVPLSAISKLKIGGRSNVSISKKSYPGTISTIGLEPANTEGKEKVYEVRVLFGSGGKLLRSGQPARVSFSQ